MRRCAMLTWWLFITPGCDDGASVCAEVTCPDSTLCSETDGECHCGGDDGPVCENDEACEGGECLSLACVDVVCEVDGTVCSSDGECHCGGADGPVCSDEEVCEGVVCLPSACVGVACEVDGTVCGGDGDCHCGGEDGPVCSDDESCDAASALCNPVIPDPRCTSGTVWSAGTQAFREVTDDWGLTGVEGVRLNLADIDGDGFVDLLVRRGPTAADEFTAGGTRSTWLLRNMEGEAFEDITEESGLLAMRTDNSGELGRPNTVAVFADVDNDGDIDAFTGLDVRDADLSLDEWSELMINDGRGSFSFATAELAVNFNRIVSPAGASFIDVNRDGNVDLWVTQSTAGGSPLQDRLHIGDGEGQFEEDTPNFGLLTSDWSSITDLNAGLSHTHGWSSAACDLNGDGTPELLSSSYARAPNHLWQGDRDENGLVTYENRSVDSGYAYDDDYTWQDNQFAACYCQDVPDAEGCDEVGTPLVTCENPWDHRTDRELFNLGGNSAATFCADVDNDGDIDLLTGETRHWWAGVGSDGGELLVNGGEVDVRFGRPGDEVTGLEADHLGLTAWDEGHMTSALFDFDNDGWLDVYIGASDYAGNRGMLYHQDSPRSFVELSTDDFFEHNRSYGVVFGDLDRDGDLDVVVGHSHARCYPSEPNNCYSTMQVRLFENVMDEGNWIQLHLVGGEGSNRAAIGARVRVTSDGVTQTQEVGGGFGQYGSQNDVVLHFGLGSACEADVTIRWPNAALTEETISLPSGYRFLVTQGELPRLEL